MTSDDSSKSLSVRGRRVLVHGDETDTQAAHVTSYNYQILRLSGLRDDKAARVAEI